MCMLKPKFLNVDLEFVAGYELTAKEQLSQFSLQAKTLKRLAELDATLAVTYYRGVESD